MEHGCRVVLANVIALDGSAKLCRGIGSSQSVRLTKAAFKLAVLLEDA